MLNLENGSCWNVFLSRLLYATLWLLLLQQISLCACARGSSGIERQYPLHSFSGGASPARPLHIANRIEHSAERTSWKIWRSNGIRQPLRHAFVTTDVTSSKKGWRCDHVDSPPPSIGHQLSWKSGWRYCIGAAGQFNHGIDPNRIIGGDFDTPPGILHSAENDEIREFSQEMWNKGVSLEEAVDRLNLLDGKQPDEVMDNFLYGNATSSADKQEDDTETSGESQENGIETSTDSGEEEEEDNDDDDDDDDDSGSATTSRESSLGSEGVSIKDDELGEVPGYVAPPEYIDEEQYRRETDERYNVMRRESELDMDDLDSDDEHHTGIEEVNYSALTNSELQLVRTLMQNKLDAPDSHEQIMKELLAGGTDGFTEKQCREYFDKFVRIGDILMGLNKTVGMQPVELDWIPEMQQRIRDFIENRGYEVASIKWTEHDVIVGLKSVKSDSGSASLHEALAMHLHTDAGIDICPGVKKLGVLMCTETLDEKETGGDVGSKGKRKPRGKKG